MDDPAEIAALCQEYVSSLDNVPHEVTHILKEIQHKDAKVQDTIPKVATRESQLRELLNKGSPGAPVSAGGTAAASGPAPSSASSAATAQPALTEQERTKAEKLLERIKLDYRRMDEWSAHKEALSKRLWRILYAHQGRLSETFARIAPGVMNTAESNVAAAMHTAPGASLLVKRPAGGQGTPVGQGGVSILGAIASALGAGGARGAAAAAGLPGLAADDGPSTPGATAAGLKRKAAAHLSLLGTGASSPFSAPALSARASHSTPHSKLSAGGGGGRAGSTDAHGRGGTPAAGSSKAGAGDALGGHTVETPTRGYHSPSQTYGRGGGGVGRPRKSGAGATKGRYGSGAAAAAGGAASGLSHVLSAGASAAAGGGAAAREGSSARSGSARSSSPSGGGGAAADVASSSSSSSAAAPASALAGAGAAAADADAGEDEKDENLYCFCQKVSYGEMIGCDAEDCPYEWFHLDCVGLKEPLPQTWYCSECQVRMRLKDSSGTKGGDKGDRGDKDKDKGEKEASVKKEGSVGASSTNSGGGGGAGAGTNKRRKKG